MKANPMEIWQQGTVSTTVNFELIGDEIIKLIIEEQMLIAKEHSCYNQKKWILWTTLVWSVIMSVLHVTLHCNVIRLWPYVVM